MLRGGLTEPIGPIEPIRREFASIEREFAFPANANSHSICIQPEPIEREFASIEREFAFERRNRRGLLLHFRSILVFEMPQDRNQPRCRIGTRGR